MFVLVLVRFIFSRNLDINSSACISDFVVSKNSPSKCSVVPNINSALEHPMSYFGDALIPSIINGRVSVQLLFNSLALIDAFNCRCNLSTIPLHCGWQAVVLFVVAPINSLSYCQSLDMNCRPVSEVIFEGVPYVDIHDNKALAHDVIVQSGGGREQYLTGYLICLSILDL